ncbi:MAG: hypothetical protein ABIP08_09030, partial [Lautropia sp.]
FATGVASSVRRNPLPVIVTGLGILWLLKSQVSQSSQENVSARGRIYTPYDGHDPTYPGASPWVDPSSDLGGRSSAGSVTSRVSEKLSGVGEAIKSQVSSVRSSVSDAGESVGDSLRGARDGLSERSQGALGSARAASQAMRDRVEEASQGAREQARRAKDEFGTLMVEQPLLMGAIGVAIGATIAALIPATRREKSVMGRASDTVTGKASELAAEGYETLRESASQSADDLARSLKNSAESKSSESKTAESKSSDAKSSGSKASADNASGNASGNAFGNASGGASGGASAATGAGQSSSKDSAWNGQFPTSAGPKDDGVKSGGIGR